MPTKQELIMLQSLPLEIKIEKTKARIREFIYFFGKENVYISFSGGKDSTVLIDIVRKEFPETQAVFVNTGLEYPEIVDFVKSFENVLIIRPEKTFEKVIKEHGFPLFSKEICNASYYYKKGSKWAKNKFESTEEFNKQYEKYSFVKDMKLSNKCCYYLKKQPIKEYEKNTKKYCITAMLAEESQIRKNGYLKNGCNSFDSKKPRSNPLGFWTEQDILQYIQENKLDICSIYGNIYQSQGKLKLSKLRRTGCVFCGMGLQLDKGQNRFERLKQTHPKLFEYVMQKLGLYELIQEANKHLKRKIRTGYENDTLF